MPDPSASTSNRSMIAAPIAAIVAATGASACCVGPLVLLTLGISGSWISNLSNLEPYRPLFMGITLLFLGLAFRKLYLVPRSCAVAAPCATDSNLRNQRIIFWLIASAAIALMSFPWYGPYLLD